MSAFSALTLLVGHQEEHLSAWPVENWVMRCWRCMEWGANNLRMVQLMPPHHLLLH